MENKIFVRIDIRSSLSFFVLTMIASAFTIFILVKAEEAISEIQKLSENSISILKEAGVADQLSMPDASTPVPSEVEGWKIYPSTGSGQAATDTSDWKLYRNEKSGFEVRYPSSWQFSGTSNPLNEHIYSFYKIHEASVQIFPKFPLDDMTAPSGSESGNVAVGQKETFIFAGRQAIKRSSNGEGLRGLIITFPNLRIRIETNDGFNDFNAEIINKILSTFKFIK